MIWPEYLSLLKLRSDCSVLYLLYLCINILLFALQKIVSSLMRFVLCMWLPISAYSLVLYSP